MSTLFPPPGIRVLTVSELTRGVKDLLEETHGNVWVQGEVSNLARPSSGHLYLTLKDEETPLRTVIYRGVALRLRYDLRDGLRVIARGRLSVYMPRGEYQLLVEELQPQGIGPLELAFRQLKEKLSVQGYFDPIRKRPLPRFPRRIALLTSPTGSAVRDVLEILNRRWPSVEVWVVPVRVQGEEAASDIAVAIGCINQVAAQTSPMPVDLIVLARGGGSLEDLWPFNEELVAHAIYRSELPVVTGIGHEDDLTIADLVADVRALTPSEAAERVVPSRQEYIELLQQTQMRLRSQMVRLVQACRARLEQAAARPCFRRPFDRLNERRQHLDSLSDRLRRALRGRLDRAAQRLQSAVARLETLSPLQVLARGYTLTRRLDDQTVIRSTDQVRVGDWIITHTAQGRFLSRVEQVIESDEYRAVARGIADNNPRMGS